MNEELIQRLVDQCVVKRERHGTTVDVLQSRPFAELIVRECIKVCNSRVGNSDYNTGRMHCASDLKEHFGVEE